MSTMSIDDQPRAVWLTRDDYELSDVALALKVRGGFVTAPADATKASYRLSRPYATVPIDVRHRSRRRLES